MIKRLFAHLPCVFNGNVESAVKYLIEYNEECILFYIIFHTQRQVLEYFYVS
jgi:hypothetical protein